MNKIILCVLSFLMLSGCALKKEGVATEEQLNDTFQIESSGDMDTFYNEDGTHRWSYPPDESYTAEETKFYIDGNACIVGDYIIGKVLMINADVMFVTIGSHCYDEKYDGIVMLKPKDINFEDIDKVQFESLIKIHYEFPEGFEPTSYLEYLDYMTYIELLEG